MGKISSTLNFNEKVIKSFYSWENQIAQSFSSSVKKEN